MGEVKILTVVPVLNEENHLNRCLSSLRSQTFDSKLHQILVLDGGSTDDTREIAERHAEESKQGGGPLVEILDNPGRHVSQARNLALERAENYTHMFEIIGHTWVPDDHLQSRVDDLLETEEFLGISIGSMGTKVHVDADGKGLVASAIECALHSRLGGSGQFAQFKGKGPASSPAFCLHRVDVVKSIGGWDDRWIAGQDHDLNHRIAEAGAPVMRSDVSFVSMSKRTTLRGLWGMGVRYGYWRMRQLRVYPSRARLREFLPWIGLIATLACYSLSFSYPEMYLRDFSYSMIGSYLSILVLVGLSSESTNQNLRRKVPLGGTCLVILSLMILHTSFSIGLLTGFLGMKPPSNERVRSANHSSNRGGN